MNGQNRAANCGRCFAALILIIVGVAIQFTHRRRAHVTPPAPSAPTSAPSASPTAEPSPLPIDGPTKNLLLAAAPGASEKDLATCVTILNRRFATAEIAGRAELVSTGKIVVHLRDEPTNLKRAGTLLAAGGHLEFKAIVGEKDRKPDWIAREIARIRGAKERKTYERANEQRDALPFEPEPGAFRLVENEGSVEGHFVASAAPRKSKEHGWVVDFQMSPEGTQAFLEFTTRIQGRLEAVILDDVVKQEFTVIEPIHGSAMLYNTGAGFSREEALALTALIQSGRLPIELALEEGEPAEAK